MTQTAVQTGPRWGRTPASQERRRAILAAAKHVFFKQGYQLASVDAIAAAAGTTKRTVYDHFGAKDALFAEAIAFACGQFVESLPKVEDLPEAPDEGLPAFVAQVRRMISSSEVVRFQRLVIAEAERQPEFGKVLHDTALLGAERVLTAYLQACVIKGRLQPQDVAVSARIIVDLATNSLRLRNLVELADADHDPVGDRALAFAMALVIRGSAPALSEF